MVILQFSFAIILIISTIIIRQQVRYAQDRESGYAKNNLIYVFLEGEMTKNYDLIKAQLLNSGAATSVSKTSAPLTQQWADTWGLKWEGKEPDSKITVDLFCADGSIVKTAGMQLLEGRDIDPGNYPTDSTACIINESLKRTAKFKNAIGQTLIDGTLKLHVVGVIRDFILESPYHQSTASH